MNKERHQLRPKVVTEGRSGEGLVAVPEGRVAKRQGPCSGCSKGDVLIEFPERFPQIYFIKVKTYNIFSLKVCVFQFQCSSLRAVVVSA